MEVGKNKKTPIDAHFKNSSVKIAAIKMIIASAIFVLVAEKNGQTDTHATVAPVTKP